MHAVSLYCSAVGLVRAILLRATRRSRPSHHRLGPTQASSALCLCEPRRPPGVKQAEPMDKNLNS